VIKYIEFFGVRTPIVMQNAPGPCPLIAIVNILLLKGRVQLPQKDQKAIGSEQLIGVVVDCLKRSMPKDLPVEHRADYEKNLRDAIDSLHGLEFGLDVNLYFDKVDHFEFTTGCVLLDLLALNLVHGWIIPESDPAYKYIVPFSYNQLLDKVVKMDTASQPVDLDFSTSYDGCASVADIREVIEVHRFWADTASQLTNAGVEQLKAHLKDGEMVVFFRNNHFNTMLKKDDQLYLLLTDLGFLETSSVVWEHLKSHSETVLVNNVFEERPMSTSIPSLRAERILNITNNDTRGTEVVRLTEWPTLEGLADLLHTVFEHDLPAAYYMQYSDEDGDLISITTTLELREAFRQAENENPKEPVLSLFVGALKKGGGVLRSSLAAESLSTPPPAETLSSSSAGSSASTAGSSGANLSQAPLKSQDLVPKSFATNVRGLLTMGFTNVEQCVATLIKHANDLNLCLEELSQLKAPRVDQPLVDPENVVIELPPMFLDRIEQLKNMGFTDARVCAQVLLNHGAILNEAVLELVTLAPAPEEPSVDEQTVDAVPVSTPSLTTAGTTSPSPSTGSSSSTDSSASSTPPASTTSASDAPAKQEEGTNDQEDSSAAWPLPTEFVDACRHLERQFGLDRAFIVRTLIRSAGNLARATERLERHVAASHATTSSTSSSSTTTTTSGSAAHPSSSRLQTPPASGAATSSSSSSALAGPSSSSSALAGPSSTSSSSSSSSSSSLRRSSPSPSPAAGPSSGGVGGELDRVPAKFRANVLELYKMGFDDFDRSVAVLKTNNGDLHKTISQLLG